MQDEGVDTIKLTRGVKLSDISVWQNPSIAGVYFLQYSANDVYRSKAGEWVAVGSSIQNKDVQIDRVAFDDGTNVSFAQLMQTNAVPADEVQRYV